MKFKLKRIDKYIIKQFLGTYVFAIMLIISISVVFDINEKIDKFLQPNVPLKDIILDYYLNFIPKVKGKITAIVAKLHVANPNLRVTIWDKATGNAIVTNYMNISSTNTEYRTPINEVVLQKDKEYVFSIKNRYFFIYRKQNSAIQTYPVTAGNIEITGSLDGDISMPNLLNSNSFVGDFSFIFQQTE